MGELKSGWRRVKFADIAECVNDRVDDPAQAGVDRYVGLEHLDPESLTIRRWSTPDQVESTKLRFWPGDIIFGKRRAYQRKLAVADFEGICSAHAMVLRARPSVVLPEFLPFFMQSDTFMERAQAISVGSLSPTINWKTLAVEEFALPPLEEQAQNISKLAAVRDVVEAQSELVTRADAMEASFCAYILRTRSPEELVRVGDVAKFTSGKSIPVSNLPSAPSENAPIPVYGGNGISGYTTTHLPGVEVPTVVIGRVGQFCGVTHLTSGPAWVTDNALYPVRLERQIDMRFLALCLRGVNLNRGKLGEYLPLVTQKVVHEARIPLPPVEQQLAYLEFFQDIHQSSLRARQRRDSSLSLRRHMLERCFSQTR